MGIFSMLNGIDLFSGIGGITLGLQEWVQPIAYCELDRYCQAVLMSRMSEGRLPRAPIWDDVSSLPVQELPVEVDVVYGGFPCTDISVAGTRNGRKGLDGERSGLFYEIIRIADYCRPQFIFLENVPAVRKWEPEIIKELNGIGYETKSLILSARECGFAHKRERWFMLAYLASCGMEGLRTEREQIIYPLEEPLLLNGPGVGEWKIEPDLRRSTDGVSRWMERVKALGNAVVPLQTREAFKRLIG